MSVVTRYRRGCHGRWVCAPPLLEDPWALGALSALATLLIAATLPLWAGGLRLLCPLREITGIPCPTCYGTRATLALLAGDWRAALRFNPLVGAAEMALVAYLPLSAVMVAWAVPRPRVSAALATRAAWAGAALVMANWIYLMIAHG